MQYATDIPQVAPLEVYEARSFKGEGENVTAKQEIRPEALTTFVFEQTIIPLEGGQQLLRLRKPLLLKISPETLRFKVTDWGIEMDCLHLPQLPRAVARRFLYLLHAAEGECLTENEQADWLLISEYLDFTQFSIDRSPPRYMEGVLRRRAEVTAVEWHDGSRETLSWKAAGALTEVELGEKFSAFVKLGKDDRTLCLERVTLLGAAGEKSDAEWESWPRKT